MRQSKMARLVKLVFRLSVSGPAFTSIAERTEPTRGAVKVDRQERGRRQGGGERRTLNLQLDLRNDSPTGLEWGYGSSGLAQLGLVLATDVLGGYEKAQQVYQRLKFKLIGGLPDERCELSEDRVGAVIDAIAKEQDRSR